MENIFKINSEKYHQERSETENIQDIYNANIESDSTEAGHKVSFSHEYSNGIQLKAEEKDDGELAITIVTKDSIVNLCTYLPEGYKIVTRRYQFNDEGVKKSNSNFACVPTHKLVIANTIRSPKDIVKVLHEMGHALINKTENNRFDYQIKISGLKGSHARAQSLSEEERLAWTNALKLARRLKTEQNLNILLETFGSLEEMQKFMYTFLTSYRYTSELEHIDTNIKNWLKSFFKNPLKDTDKESLEKLFDKKKLSRKFGLVKSKNGAR